jgi:hypothetical protein
VDAATGDKPDPGDCHERVIAVDLKGQEEFSWGEVGCKLVEAGQKEWLVVTYADGPAVLGTSAGGVGTHH